LTRHAHPSLGVTGPGRTLALVLVVILLGILPL
jgi:hypothetical protein